MPPISSNFSYVDYWISEVEPEDSPRNIAKIHYDFNQHHSIPYKKDVFSSKLRARILEESYDNNGETLKALTEEDLIPTPDFQEYKDISFKYNDEEKLIFKLN